MFQGSTLYSLRNEKHFQGAVPHTRLWGAKGWFASGWDASAKLDWFGIMCPVKINYHIKNVNIIEDLSSHLHIHTVTIKYIYINKIFIIQSCTNILIPINECPSQIKFFSKQYKLKMLLILLNTYLSLYYQSFSKILQKLPWTSNILLRDLGSCNLHSAIRWCDFSGHFRVEHITTAKCETWTSCWTSTLSDSRLS